MSTAHTPDQAAVLGSMSTAPRARLITDDEFVAEFKPVKNHLDCNSSYNGTLFETYGADVEAVKKAPAEKVWTLMDDDDGNAVISSGWSHVNRIGYFITEKPFKDQFITVIDEPDAFFGKARRRGELRKLETLYDLSPGMQEEFTAAKARWSAARKSAKP